MVAVARLGGRAGFVGTVGDDERGTWIQDDFRSFGVDASRMVVQTGATSHLTVVLVDERTGSRAFLSSRGNLGLVQPQDLDRTYLTSAAILHLSDASPASLQAARWAKEAGMQVGFDGTHFHPSLLPILPLLDYLIASRFFAGDYAAYRSGRGIGRMALSFAGLSNSGVASGRAAQTGDERQHEHDVPSEAPHLQTDAAPATNGERLLDIARQLQEQGPRVVDTTCVSRVQVPARRPWASEPIGHDANAQLAAGREDLVLPAPVKQVVAHLVGHQRCVRGGGAKTLSVERWRPPPGVPCRRPSPPAALPSSPRTACARPASAPATGRYSLC